MTTISILGDLISNVESKTCPEGFWLNNFGPLVENRVKTVEKIFLLSKFLEALFNFRLLANGNSITKNTSKLQILYIIQEGLGQWDTSSVEDCIA